MRERERSRERVSPAPSPEERDVLNRGRKKFRSPGRNFTGDRHLEPRDEDWMHDMDTKATGGRVEDGQRGVGWKSFKEVVSSDSGDVEEETDWWSNDKWKDRITVEMSSLGPNVIFPPDEKERLAKKWRNALIIKLLGRMVDPIYLTSKVQQLWAKAGEVETIDIGAGFFIVQFTAMSDYDLALTGGPWLIFDHYISVQPWKQDFDPDTEVVTKIAAWIRFAKLPLEYYDRGALYVLGSQVGRVLKVDMATLKRKKGRFAPLCVELDLAVPLPPFILINGKATRIQYEGIHLICFKCGRYGHDADHCPHRAVDSDKPEPEVAGGSMKGGQTVHNSGGKGEDIVQDASSSGVTPTTQYDQWMILQRPRRIR